MKVFNGPSAKNIEELKNQYKLLNYLYVFDYNPQIQNRMERMFDEMIINLEILNINNKLTMNFNVISDLNKITALNLVIGGIGDGIIPKSQVQRLHDNISNSEIHLFKKSGHYPFLEESDAFIRVISEWLTRIS